MDLFGLFGALEEESFPSITVVTDYQIELDKLYSGIEFGAKISSDLRYFREHISNLYKLIEFEEEVVFEMERIRAPSHRISDIFYIY